MKRERDKMVERIINLTLEILYWLTGEDYTVVKKTSSERCQAPVSEGWGRTLSPIMRPPPHSLIHEEINEQKILELIHKMVELLTGEVPIRCQDVTVYFSMEEWEYVEGHKDLYKDVLMEKHQPLTSTGRSSKRTTPERCPSPLPPQDHQILNQDKDLNSINATEIYVWGDDQCKEDIPTEIYVWGDDQCKEDIPTEMYVWGDDQCKEGILTHKHPDVYTGSSEGHLKCSDLKADGCGITQDTCEEHVFILDVPSAVHSKDLSSDPLKNLQSSDSSQTVKKYKDHQMSVVRKISDKRKKSQPCSECGECFKNKSHLFKHQRTHTGEKLFSCSECRKCFSRKGSLVEHQKTHTGEKTFSCTVCGKDFNQKSDLTGHQRIHIGKTFSCPECEKCFSKKAHLKMHLRIHTGEKPFSCSECGKCFTQKACLKRHERIHTGEKPFFCSECGKCYGARSNLLAHQKIHTGERPFFCSECGKCFSRRGHLDKHQNTHRGGEKPFSCTTCGKGFKRKADLTAHQRIHTGDAFPCPECGTCFVQKSHLRIHQRIHTGEKPFSCSECGKCFNRRSHLVRHENIHRGEKPFSFYDLFY
ncbi:oocyte zinc finger protein XlCOF7.1-like [Bufo gargarizans]|uniref:oocyte zinc finger protein XlCOF7.1-like n=1 Tax=Bufo gargarizans TaxID=30331 RepID=UPI001CF4257E|nr:oocyte zinc finger protein XlCOF7.1-like [Bufo gargarizans]XP_044132562.1 oocyte zinc finger protein XlCOF7.1-like [Bufo gargarizans]